MPRDSSFRAYRLSTLPASIDGPFARELTGALGDLQDEELDLLEVAIKCRLPKYCPDGALDKLGPVFAIERYPGESHTSYRARLEAAWPTWEAAGTAAAIEAQIAAYGYQATCYETPTFRAGPGAQQHMFWVVLSVSTVFDIGPMALGGWALGEATLGTNASADIVRAIKRIILKWKAAHAYPVSVIVLLDDEPRLGIGTALGGWALGAGEDAIHWPIGRLLGTNQTHLGSWVLGGYEI